MSGKISDNLGRSSGLVKSAGGGGKILQVQTTTVTASQSVAQADTWRDVTGLSVAITPAATSSKILILCFFGVSADNEHTARLLRDSTVICLGDAGSGGNRQRGVGCWDSNGDMSYSTTVSFVDSPSTTSEITYKMQGACDASTTQMWGITYNNSDEFCTTQSPMTITAMEIGV